MAPTELSELVSYLDETHREMHEAVAGLTESQASTPPDPARWSVLECLEHVIAVERLFLGRLQTAERAAAPAPDKERERSLAERVADRSERRQAPEAVRPSGRFPNLHAAIDAFDAAREETVRFARDRRQELYSLATSHPRLGPLNGYEFLLLIAAHGRRHAAQIRETRAALRA